MENNNKKTGPGEYSISPVRTLIEKVLMWQMLNILLLTLLFPGVAFTQQIHSSSSIIETQHFEIESFTLPGGYNGNIVHAIIQGPNGFLWFGSYAGLHRFDGHEILTYSTHGDTLNNDSALAHSDLECLYWDQNDLLWIGTWGGGLYQFDPKTEQFKNYKHQNNNSISLSDDRVLSISEDGKENLWIGTVNGLNRFDQKTDHFERYYYDSDNSKSISNNYISHIYLDKKGTLWIGTGFFRESHESGGLNRFDPTTNSFVRYLHDPNDSISLWSNPIKGILEDSSGDFWVTSTAGLQKMDRDNGRFERMKYHPNKPHAPGAEQKELPIAFSLIEDTKNGLWISTFNKFANGSQLLRYDQLNQTIENFPITDRIFHLFESNDGSIWASSGYASSKVFKISPKEKSFNLRKGATVFNDFKKSALYLKLGIGGIEEAMIGPLSLGFNSNDGTMWGIYIFDVFKNENVKHFPVLVNFNQDNLETRFYYPKELNLDLLNTSPYLGNPGSEWASKGTAIDDDGRIWGAYPFDLNGIFRFDPKTGTTEIYKHIPGETNSLLPGQVIYLMRDSRGFIWTSHKDKGLNRLDPSTGKSFHYFADNHGPGRIGGFFPIAISEDKNGRIWVGGQNEHNRPLLTVIDIGSDTSMDIELPVNLRNLIRSIACHGNRLVFAIDGFGLGVVDIEQLDAPISWFSSVVNNFPIDVASSITFDNEGILWVGSYIDNRIVRLDLKRNNWLLINTKTKGPSLSRISTLGINTHVYFPVQNYGWRVINPDQFNGSLSSFVHFKSTDLFIDGQRQISSKSSFLTKPIWEYDQLSLPHNAMPIKFRFSNFDFKSDHIQYKYRLNRFDPKWKTLHGEHEVVFSHLPVGSYQLQVQAFDNKRFVNDKRIELELIILPPWWNTRWAYLLYALLIILILAIANYFQRRRWKIQAQLQLEKERAGRLKELDRFKSRFYTNITHEFRTPLTVIKGMANRLEENEKAKIMIQRNIEKLLNMVNQLLDLSKLENNSLPIDWIQGDIIPFLNYLIESCHSLAKDKHINLAFFTKEESLVMDFDKNKLQQIVINLLSNAIKFTPEYGSVKVIASKFKENKSSFMLLEVKDTGKGIPPEDLDYIFDRFFQVNETAKLEEEGSGIGLALVKELVNLQSGRIEVQSELSKGSVFKIYLPIHNWAPNDSTQISSVKKIPEPENKHENHIEQGDLNNGEKPQVLIIEDSADVREYIVSCLGEKYVLQTARDGKQGLEIAFETVPDVILCDVMMPQMDGLEVCKKLKTDLRTSHVPVILLTARAAQDDRIDGFSHGADAYIVKPFDENELLIRITNLVAQSKRLKESINTIGIQYQLSGQSENQEILFLQNLDEIIEKNMGNELFDTNFLCREIALSRTQLYRKLKALTGYSTADYIRTARLNKARVLLETTDIPVGEIATKVGYKDFSHFTKSFSKKFGVKPSETRN